jgi:hypothetical protein
VRPVSGMKHASKDLILDESDPIWIMEEVSPGDTGWDPNLIIFSSLDWDCRVSAICRHNIMHLSLI